jgi:hypothetical protein
VRCHPHAASVSTGVLLALAATFPAANLDAITIAANGTPRAVIVAPADAPSPVRFAAEELKRFLDRVTGAEFAIVWAVPKATPAIVLGEDLAKQAGVSIDGLTRDGYVLKTIGQRLYVAGKDDRGGRSKILFSVFDGPLPDNASGTDRVRAWGDLAWDFERGTLHGAYDLLERLGVRWFFPGDAGMVVPKTGDIALPALDVREEPHFLLRMNQRIIFPSPRYLKMGVFKLDEYNELGWHGRNQRLWMVRMRSSSRHMAFNHRPHRQQWSRRFAAEHPDYFALQRDGKRMTGGRKQRHYLNYTSPGVFEETLNDIEAYFSGQPAEARGLRSHEKFELNRGWDPASCYGDSFSLLPNDGLRVDYSPESQRFLHEDMPFPHRHSDYVWQFIERVARAVKPRFPDKVLTCLAYQTYWEIPQSVTSLPDNVVVGIAALSGCSRMSMSANPKRYAEFLDLIERWSRMSKQPMLFWHYSLFRHNQGSLKGVPMVLPRHASTVFRDLAKHGRYMFMQNDFDNIMFDHVNRYVYSRLMWDPRADVDALLADYHRSFYGPAAEPMAVFFDDVEERCVALASARADAVAIWEVHFDSATLTRYRMLLNQALTVAKGTEYGPRIERISRRFLGAMEAQRQVYVSDVKALRDKGADIVLVRRGKRPIVVDGRIDEKEWLRTGGKHFRNNVDGKGTRQPGRVRTRYRDGHLYVACDITHGEARDMLERQGKVDYVEIFLDATQEDEIYHWLMVNMRGEVVQHLYPAPGEPPDTSWDSRADIRVEVEDGAWRLELGLPLAALGLKEGATVDLDVRGNVCLTRFTAHGTKDMFSSINPIMRGRFHNPGMFARFQFEQ